MNTPVRRVLDNNTGKTVVYSPGSNEYVTSTTGEVPAFKQFISDEKSYGDAISSLVQKTCDVLLYDPETGRVLVATRAIEPQAGDWVVGGRKRAGERDTEAALRNLDRELGAKVAEMAVGRLDKIGSYDVIWDSREQPATINESGQAVTGSHQAPTVFALPVAEAEFNAIASPNEEYASLRWEDSFDIIESPDGTYHPAFRDIVEDAMDMATRPQ